MNQKCIIFKAYIRNIVSYQYYEKLRSEKDASVFKKKLYSMNWNILPSYEDYICNNITPINADIVSYEKVNEMLEIISYDCEGDFISYFKSFCELNNCDQFFNIIDDALIPQEIKNIINYITIPNYFSKNEKEIKVLTSDTTEVKFSKYEFFQFKDKCKKLSEAYIKDSISNPIKKKKYLNELDILFKDNTAINKLLNEKVISSDFIDPKAITALIVDFTDEKVEEVIEENISDELDSSDTEEEIDQSSIENSKIKCPIYEVNANNIHDAIVDMLFYYDGLFISFIKKHLKTSLSDKQIYKLIHDGAELGFYKKNKNKDILYAGKPVDQFYKIESKRKYYFYKGKNYKVIDLCQTFDISYQVFNRRIKTMNHVDALELPINEKMIRKI